MVIEPALQEALARRVAALMPHLRTDLERLVRLPSVAFAGYPEGPLRHTAEAVAVLLRAAGLPQVDLLEIPDAPPVVFGERPAQPGAPTVLLYAHYDVQPAGDESAWTSPPFAPEERAGRLYGRGAADDKSGVVTHVGALQAVGPDSPLGIKVLIEGQEEVGTGSLEAFVAQRPGLVAADAIVIADLNNYALGVPTLTTSLRGLVAVDVEVQTLAGPLHSGQFGGPAPDALIALCRIIAALHDEAGNVAIEGLERISYDGPPYEEQDYREHAAMLPDVDLIGDAPVAEALFARPSANVIGIEAPRLQGAVNALIPRARARLSVRLAPGQNPDEARTAVKHHVLASAPWNVKVTVTPAAVARGFLARTDGPAYAAAAEALRAAFGREVVHVGQGASIPLVAAMHETVPDAEMILWGASEPLSQIHAPNESIDLSELQRSILAEALLLATFRG